MSKKSKSKAPTKNRWGSLGYAVFLVFALAIGTGAGWLNQSEVIRKMIFAPKDPKQTFGSDSVTLLILGCDEDLQDNTGKVLKKQARSDMMLVAKLDFANHMITGVSIPRDTECQLPGYHRLKINAYHNIAKKGHEAELTQRAVEFLLPNVKIDRVVTLDFDAFQQVVNLVGGVPINSEKNLDYDDNAGHLHIHIKKGPQMMNGYNAMCYVRFRHGDSDFARQQRQKQFLMSFKGQVLKDWT
jgi:LCP family protein required for cell wall assembly